MGFNFCNRICKEFWKFGVIQIPRGVRVFGDGRGCDVEMKMVGGEGLGLGFSRKCVDVVVPF